MATDNLVSGVLVSSALMPGWGPGKIVKVEGSVATVVFRDVPEGEATKRLKLDAARLTALADQTDTALEVRVARVSRGPRKGGGRKGRVAVPALAFDHALELFGKRYPDLFVGKAYIAEERTYKDKAHVLYGELLGDLTGVALVASGDSATLAANFIAVARGVNLANWIELAAFGEGLQDGAAALCYAEAVFAFIDESSPTATAFDRLAEVVGSLPAKKGRAAVDKWTILTLVPHLAAPDRVMYMKPIATQSIAAGLGVDLLYHPRPRWDTYQRLLGLAEQLLDRLRPHGARDFIDVQTFIWRSHQLSK